MSNTKKKTRFLQPIFIRFLGHAPWHPSIYAPSFALNESPYTIAKLLKIAVLILILDKLV